MKSTTIRVSEKTRKTLRELATARGESIQEVADKAVELFRRQRIMEETNAAYAALRQDPAAWQQELEERALWDGTLNDGLEEAS